MVHKDMHGIQEFEGISIRQLGQFIFGRWKFIALCAVVGAGLGLLFWGISPLKYQAVINIKMAQVMKLTQDGQYSSVNVEAPDVLVEKLRMPGFYLDPTLLKCGLSVGDQAKEQLAHATRSSLVKGAGSEIVISVDSISTETAVICSQAIFEQIRDGQANLLEKVTKAARLKKIRLEKRSKDIEKVVKKVDEQNGPVSGMYLVSRDQLNNINIEIERLNDMIDFGEKNQAELIQPIATSLSSKYIGKYRAILFGILLGFLLGVTLTILHCVKRSEKKQKLNFDSGDS